MKYGRLTIAGFLAFSLLAAALARGSEAASERNPWTVPGTLRVALASLPNTLDPVIRTQVIEGFIDGFMVEPLLAQAIDGRLEPKLAREVPSLANGGISADGRSITYRLRRGVRWHDGRPFTSADVRFTYEAVMDPRNSVSARVGYEDVSTLDTPDPYTVIAHLKRASAPFLREFGTAIVPAHAFKDAGSLDRADYGAAPIGTGPFTFVRWKRGESIELSANDAYYLGKPKIRKIVISFFGDENAEENAMLAHAIDWVFSVSPTFYQRTAREPGLTVATTPINAIQGLAINTTHPPLDDVRVRRAIALAIDRETIAAKTYYGLVKPADADLPAFMNMREPGFVGQHFDLGQAGRELDAAGWLRGPDGIRMRAGKPLELTMVAVSGPFTAVAVQVQAMLRNVGIVANIKAMDANVLFAARTGLLPSGNFDVAYTAINQTTDPDNSGSFTCANRAPLGFNRSRYCNPQLDAAERDAEGHYDLPTRRKAYARIERILADEAPWAFVVWPERIDVYNSDFRGLEIAPGHLSLSPETWSIGE